MTRFVLLVCFLTMLPQSTMAQQVADGQKKSGFRKTSLFPLPLVYYTPETGWAGGIALFSAFRMPGQTDAERPSQAQLGFAYTQRRQVLFYLPYQFFWSKERNQAYGEIGYYRYTYLFYGIGNHNPKSAEETYDVNFPRFRLNWLRAVWPHHYLGVRYWWDNYQIQKTEPGKQLSGGQITGSQGGVLSGAGLLYNYDTRDDVFYPAKGFWAETEVFLNQPWMGSDFRFSRISVDAAGYFSGKSDRHVLALNVWLSSIQGAAPFQQLAFIGGPKKMRGYFEGQLRDRNLWMFQAEWRIKLARRFGLAVFSGTGAVAANPDDLFLASPHLTYGAGIRFRISKKEKVNLRLDIAGNETGEILPYLTVKEAF